MATYTVYISFVAGKGSSARFRYPTTSGTTGVGHSSSNPLQLNAGDNVKFVEVSGSSGGGTVSGLSLFTNNANFNYSGGDGIGEIADRTVASGTTPSSVDTITVTPAIGSDGDNFYFQRVSSFTAPVIDYVYHNDGDTNTPSVFVILSSQGSGGTLKFAQSTTNSVPSTGWQTNSGFTQTRGTTRYYWASQNEDTEGFSTSEELVIPSANPNLPSFPSSTYGLAVFNSDGNPMYTTRRRSIVLQYSNTVTIAANSSTTISNIENADDEEQVFIQITGVNSYSTSVGVGGAVRISSRNSTSFTLQNLDNVSSRTVKVQVYRHC